MENLSCEFQTEAFRNFLKPEASSVERKFRRAAGLCSRCGLARAGRKTFGNLCADCLEQAQIEKWHSRWRKWGIAA